ncbi:MAG: signal peptidase I [Bacteroidota bacterium]
MSRLALGLTLVLALSGCRDRFYRVPSESMAPTFQPGDFVVRQDLGDPESDVRRGMIVMFETFEGVTEVIPDAEPGGMFIFRVVGLAGDRLALRRDTLMVNGRPVREPYAMYDAAHASRDSLRAWSDFEETLVPEATVFVLGDNRYNALDSRYVGPVPLERLRGFVEAE